MFFTSLSFLLSFQPFYCLYYISHLIMIHTWPFVFVRLLEEMNCARAHTQHTHTHTIRKRSKRPFAFSFSSFLLAYRVYRCTRTPCVFLFLSLSLFFSLRRRMYRGYIVFQACSRCPRRFISIYYSLTNRARGKNERAREEKKNERMSSQQLPNEYESG